MGWFYRRHGPPLSTWRPARAWAVRLLRDGWPQMLSVLSILIYMKIDQVMLGQMSGEHQVGLYAAACRLSELWYFLPMALIANLFPSIVAIREVNRPLYYRRMLWLFSLMSAVSLAVSAGIWWCSDWLVLSLYKAPFAAAAPILTIHVWSSLFVFLGTAQEPWNVAEGLMRLSLFRTASGAVMNVLLNLVLIPRYGGVGAAWATLISYAWSATFSNLLFKETRPMFWLQVKSIAFPWVWVGRRWRGQGAASAG
jgi:polysaccharide transporter, PST family